MLASKAGSERGSSARGERTALRIPLPNFMGHSVQIIGSGRFAPLLSPSRWAHSRSLPPGAEGHS